MCLRIAQIKANAGPVSGFGGKLAQGWALLKRRARLTSAGLVTGLPLWCIAGSSVHSLSYTLRFGRCATSGHSGWGQASC